MSHGFSDWEDDSKRKRRIQRLHKAVKEGQLESVLGLCTSDTVNAESEEDGSNVLILAAKHGRLDIIRALLERYGEKQALMSGTGDSRIPIKPRQSAYPLSPSKFNIDAADKNQWTALMWAAFKGNTTLVRLLARHGANVERQSRLGVSALVSAAGNAQYDTVQALISVGAGMKNMSPDEQSPWLAIVNQTAEGVAAVQRGRLLFMAYASAFPIRFPDTIWDIIVKYWQ